MGEYNQPHPSFYQCEMVPELFAYSGFWGYDAVALYSYSHEYNFTRRHWGNFFDIHCDPKIMVQLVPWAIAHRRGDITLSTTPVTIDYKLEDIFDFDIEMRNEWLPPLTPDGHLDRYCFFEHAVSRGDMHASETPPGNSYGISSPPGPIYISDTNELSWNILDGIFTVDTDGICAVVGNLAGNEISAGPLTVVLTDPNFASITAVALETSSIVEADSLLIVAVGRSGNRNMGWNAELTSVGDNWGIPPTYMEPVLGQISIDWGGDSTVVYPLDTLGLPRDSLGTYFVDSKITYDLVGNTPWYLLVRKPLVGVEEETMATRIRNSLDVYPNPFNYTLTIKYSVASREKTELKIYNLIGQLVKTLINTPHNAGSYIVYWDGTNESGKSVGSGIYFCQLKVGDEFLKIKKLLLLK